MKRARSILFLYFYYLTVLWEGGPPRLLQRARAPRKPRRGQSPAIRNALVQASVPGPTSVRTRPWHVGASGLSRPLRPHAKAVSETLRKFENAKEASTTIKSYGWYSGLYLRATVGQVCTASSYFETMLPPNRIKCEGLG